MILYQGTSDHPFISGLCDESDVNSGNKLVKTGNKKRLKTYSLNLLTPVSTTYFPLTVKPFLEPHFRHNVAKVNIFNVHCYF